MEAGSAPAPNHEDEPDLEPAVGPAPEGVESVAVEPVTPEPVEVPPADSAVDPPAPPDSAPLGRRRADQVALALLAGIVVLLLICVVIALIAWRHAPVNPAIPAANLPPLGSPFT